MLPVVTISNSVFASRTYVMQSGRSDSVWLVDCGDFDKVLEKIGGRKIAGVLLTHAHFDHIYGIPELLGCCPCCRIVTNGAGLEALGDPRINLSRYHGTPMAVSSDNIFLVHEGDDIPLFDGLFAKVYETPGHHPSCLTFEVGEYLFTGDAYIPGEKVITNLPGGDKVKAVVSVSRILELGRDKIIMAGHGMRDNNMVSQSLFP